MPTIDPRTSRRLFLQFLAASPLYASSTLAAYAAETPSRLPDPMIWAPRDLDHLIATPKEAINVFDFEPVMHKNVPPGHFGYMASGIDDEVTLRANREGFQKFQLRPRRLVDVSKVDMSTEILGVKYDTPIFLSPSGGHKGYHPDGEPAVVGAPHIGIVTAYNDMLSAHQPYEGYPEQIRRDAAALGATVQVAGGVPAMCDGVTQGAPGMELSLFSRDVIALSTAVALSHQMFDAAVYLGVCDKIVPGLLIGALSFGHLPAVFLPAGPMTSGLSNDEKSKTRSWRSCNRNIRRAAWRRAWPRRVAPWNWCCCNTREA